MEPPESALAAGRARRRRFQTSISRGPKIVRRIAIFVQTLENKLAAISPYKIGQLFDENKCATFRASLLDTREI